MFIVTCKAARRTLLAAALLTIGLSSSAWAQTVKEEVIWSTVGSSGAVDESDLNTYEMEAAKVRTIGGLDSYSPFTGGSTTAPAGTKVDVYYNIAGSPAFGCDPAPATCAYSVIVTYKNPNSSNGVLTVSLRRVDIGTVFTAPTGNFAGNAGQQPNVNGNLNFTSNFKTTSGTKPASWRTPSASTDVNGFPVFDFDKFSYFFHVTLEKKTVDTANVELQGIKIVKATTTP